MKHNNVFFITAVVVAIVAVVLSALTGLLLGIVLLNPAPNTELLVKVLAIIALVPAPLLILAYGFWRRHVLSSNPHRFLSDIGGDYEAYANKEKSKFAFRIALRRFNRFAKNQAAADPCWAEIRTAEAIATWKDRAVPGTEDWEE